MSNKAVLSLNATFGQDCSYNTSLKRDILSKCMYGEFSH